MTWERMQKLAKHCIPQSAPFTGVPRHDLRQEPQAGLPHVRIRAGGAWGNPRLDRDLRGANPSETDFR